MCVTILKTEAKKGVDLPVRLECSLLFEEVVNLLKQARSCFSNEPRLGESPPFVNTTHLHFFTNSIKHNGKIILEYLVTYSIAVFKLC